jgi:hypothetical protein
LLPLGARDLEVAADWKLLVEQWLEGARVSGRFLAPNQLIESWHGGATVLRVVPVAPGRSRLQRLDYGARGTAAKGAGRAGGTRPSEPPEVPGTWVTQQVELAESTQAGLAALHGEVAAGEPVSAALAEFRGSIAVLLPHLRAK